MSTSHRSNFGNAGYYFLGLVILILLGFWNSYFSQMGSWATEFNAYFHFHSALAFAWVLMVIIQPVLIKKGQVQLHRSIGKLSYLLMPLIFLSVILLVHSRHTLGEERLDMRLLTPFKDLIVLGVAYFIAIRYRKTTAIHARGMIATGIVFIEPALIRLIRNYTDLPLPYLFTILTVYAILIGLMIAERKAKRGRWVFPLILGLYIVLHGIRISGLRIGLLERFAEWFIQLPIT